MPWVLRLTQNTWWFIFNIFKHFWSPNKIVSSLARRTDSNTCDRIRRCDWLLISDYACLLGQLNNLYCRPLFNTHLCFILHLCGPYSFWGRAHYLASEQKVNTLKPSVMMSFDFVLAPPPTALKYFRLRNFTYQACYGFQELSKRAARWDHLRKSITSRNHHPDKSTMVKFEPWFHGWKASRKVPLLYFSLIGPGEEKTYKELFARLTH